MAAKRRAKRTVTKEVMEEPMMEEMQMPVMETKSQTPKKMNKKWMIGLAAVAALVFFWYKTNSWPIVAFVGLQPVTRYEVYKTLYSQGGDDTVDSLITEKLVKNELARMGVTVTDAELNTRIDEIRQQLGESVVLEDLIKERGLTMSEVKDQLSLQMKIEKAMADKVSVSEEDIDKFVTDNSAYLAGTTSAEKRVEAENALRQTGLQTEISAWIEELRSKAKIYKIKTS